MEDANRILEPTLALHLELDRIQPWSRTASDDLQATLAALGRDDAGEGADLVVGMIGALPRQTDALHKAGMATMPGKHLVVRAASREGEHDAIDRAFSELSEDERIRLVRKRKRHRALAVLLHEIGHCLGALHESDVRSLMNPAYDPKMSGFGGGAVALMRITLDSPDRAAAFRAQLALLAGAQREAWVASERDEAVQRLRAALDAAGPPNAAAGASGDRSATDGAMAGVPPELSGDARDRFVQARQAYRAGAARIAYDTAKPLFEKYPNVYAVQDLRCQLATIRWLAPDELKSECAAFARLSPDSGSRGP
jgi:hypothetical protein